GLAAGDFNRDGKLDLAAVNANTPAGAGTVAVLHGLGNGTFTPATHYPAGPSPTAIATGDFNRDGMPDLAVANDRPWPGSTPSGPQLHGAAVLLGSNTGFGSPIRLPLSFPSTAVATSALPVPANVAVLSPLLAFAGPDAQVSPAQTLIAIVPGLLNTTILPAVQFVVPGVNRGLAAANFTRDGRMDVAAVQSIGLTVGSNANTSVYTIFSRPVITPASPPYALAGPFATGLSSAVGIVSADFDRDGHGDVAVAGARALGPQLPALVGSVSALAGNGSGQLAAPRRFDVGPLPAGFASGFVNRDGRTDLVTTSSVGVSALLAAPGPRPSLDMEAAAPGDDNPNGPVDLALWE
ncbi:MAG: VCBS repeat-containing protein, partial [Phycisphaerae bacterium]|nr:VCBS repeat-containing protein [Phycisphaerae bacterium]MDW8262418.1 VCBS repeat-containing protein [Phycisphaerales bacterium]